MLTDWGTTVLRTEKNYLFIAHEKFAPVFGYI
jgi:hypothetical protein